jgi:Cu(I)/Ag(I) efflux system periplasmic protein CusF
MNFGSQLAVLLGIALAAPAFAQKPADDHSAHRAVPKAQSAALSEGEVRKVDKGAKKITIKHGPLINLDMPAMTMVFQVKDPKMLEQVKVGDKIKFTAEKFGGQFMVTTVEQKK